MTFQTALFTRHQKENARIVDFAGWDMPLQYSSITAEHMAVRETAGIFDVGHMGRFFLQGEHATRFLEKMVVSRVDDLIPGQVRYSVVCNSEGGCKDDVLITRLEKDAYLVVVNASNREKLASWFNEHLEPGIDFKDDTFATGMIAIQGPEALQIGELILKTELDSIPYYHSRQLGDRFFVSRTGYTGEDGFEIIAPNDQIEQLWQDARREGAQPIGLGARDSLRLEMGYSLYGHELSETISPLEAGLSWVVNLEKDDFIGKSALARQKLEGIPRRRIGLVPDGAGIPRQGYALFDGEEKIGETTSGGFSTTLKKGIGLGLIRSGRQNAENLSVEIRGKKVSAIIRKPPFVASRVKK
ncbi:MAG: glycine cleavage system aminomethyltransferase GcvT [Candidatus Omnitrophota bacterium]|jgi:aminomethyltransferase|nr:MAG: glycine cleavage system aminomethyltransferase GcvT [Candidatus Omnitrophota bacterium]